MEDFNIKLLTSEQKETRRRILEISYTRRFSHLGSCLSSVDLIDAVYKVKKRNEKFILSNGHAGVALYTILEKNGLIKNPEITKNLHVHPDRDPKLGIDVSTGSLGQGLPIALGMAFANKNENTYCLISDGECTEGSIWETLRIANDKGVRNLKILLNANGWSAYNSISLPTLSKRIVGFGYRVSEVNGHDINVLLGVLKTPTQDNPIVLFAKTTVEQFSFLKGQDAHYHIMSQKDYALALEELK